MNTHTSKNQTQTRCLLCNGKHSHEVPNSCPLLTYTRDKKGKKIIGKYHPVLAEVLSLMNDPNSLQLESLNIQSLRLMATCFVYENSDNLIVCCEKKNTGPNFDKEFQYNPIPLTLSRKRLQKELTKKWEKIHALKRKKRDGPPELLSEHSCPICLEEMGKYKWFHYEYRFVTNVERVQTEIQHGRTCYKYTNGTNPVKTSCGHIMCSNCTSRLVPNANFRTLSDYNHEVCRDAAKYRLYQMYNMSCPLCRSNSIVEKRLGLDKDKFWGNKRQNSWVFRRPKTTYHEGMRGRYWCDDPLSDESNLSNVYA